MSFLKCSSDEEAIDKAVEIKNGSNNYPVYYSGFNTSGEKVYEEFYTDSECVDLARLKSLGVVTGKDIIDKAKVKTLLD